jgi:hypothetical protein
MNKFYWAIFSGKTMLPFTMRTTRKQSIGDHERDTKRALLDHETCQKVRVYKFERP